MVPKRKAVDVPTVIEGKYKYALFGWCTTAEHEGCRVEFPGHRCSCDCHKGKQDGSI